MKVKAVSDNLFQLTHLGAINCYLVREDDGFTLIDTAWPASQGAAILNEASKLGLPIVRILLTHGHIDHVGSLDALHEALPEVPVAISARDARLLVGDASLDPGEPKDGRKLGTYLCKTKPDSFLNEGDRIGSLEVVNTPGHSPGHVAFLDTRDQALIAGDALQTLGGVAVSGTMKILFPLPAMSSWHDGLSLASARKLLALQPSLLAIGHGRVLVDPQAEMARAIEVLERSVAQAERKKAHVA